MHETILQITLCMDLSPIFALSTSCPGNLKTLTPSPQTPATDWVCGLPTVRSMNYTYGPSTDHPPNKIKHKNKDFPHCLSNRSLVSAKFRHYAGLHWVNVTELQLNTK